MASLRYRVSRRLLEMGATMALDCREMRRRMPGSVQTVTADNQVLTLVELLSDASIRLGMAVMPARLPRP